MFSSIFETSNPLSSVVVSRPASASVETFGLSTMAMSGRLPAPGGGALAGAPVLPALRLIVMSRSAAQASMALAQVDSASRSGYGSQRGYSVDAADGASPGEDNPGG